MLFNKTDILAAIDRRMAEKLLECAKDLDQHTTTKVRAQRLELSSLREEIVATDEPNIDEILL